MTRPPMPRGSDKRLATVCVHLRPLVSPGHCYESHSYQRPFAKVRAWPQRILTSPLRTFIFEVSGKWQDCL